MAYLRDTLDDINKNTAQTARSASQAAQQAAQQTQTLQGVQFNTAVSAAAGLMTAANTAKQARLQEEQLAIQQAMAAQAQNHQFAMWRQTGDGMAFIEWQHRAINLIYLLRGREQTWKEAWSRAILQAQAQVPADEMARFAERPKKIAQKPLKVILIILLAASILLLLDYSNFRTFVFGLVVAATQQRETVFISDVAASITSIISIAVFAVTFFVWRLRRKRVKIATNDQVCVQESNARMSKWGFDPLDADASYVGFGWTYFDGLYNYTQKIENLVLNGKTLFPAQSHLSALVIPDSVLPNDGFPEPINNALISFAQQTQDMTS